MDSSNSNEKGIMVAMIVIIAVSFCSSFTSCASSMIFIWKVYKPKADIPPECSNVKHDIATWSESDRNDYISIVNQQYPAISVPYLQSLDNFGVYRILRKHCPQA